jgi:hypothetical protein
LFVCACVRRMLPFLKDDRFPTSPGSERTVRGRSGDGP